ncbi:uncharacterized protein [Ptychodera flava]|uniref:uncharacterized protein n=1 Tax=Ptychodera flava TaxID=63121 RepID=UPI00396A57DA
MRMRCKPQDVGVPRILCSLIASSYDGGGGSCSLESGSKLSLRYPPLQREGNQVDDNQSVNQSITKSINHQSIDQSKVQHHDDEEEEEEENNPRPRRILQTQNKVRSREAYPSSWDVVQKEFRLDLLGLHV